MAHNAEEGNSNLRMILGLTAHLSVFAMFAAFLPLGGRALWLLILPPIALLIIGAVVATRRQTDPNPGGQ